jgi:DNA polymerase III subunit gamma/tau
MAVLYRKYRPQTFSEVLNQKPIIQTLKNQVKSGAVAHAYLFTGSRGVGKTSVARILAKAVNCQGTDSQGKLTAQEVGDACGNCEVCRQIENGNFLDLVEIDAASNTGVDNIRELIEHVKFSPSIGKYKVFIIDEVHMLSKGAFNALLKTLEEPPKHAIFVLATTEINKVPATIISRTQRFDFRAYSAADLLPLLKKISLAENFNFGSDILDLVAQNADGSARDALSLLDKLMTLGEKASLEECQQLLGITNIEVCEKLLDLIAESKAAEIPDFFTELSVSGADYSIFNRDFLEFLRKVLIDKITSGGINNGLPEEHKEKISRLSASFTETELIFVIRLFLKSYKDLAYSPDEQIPLLLSSLEAALKKSPDKNSALKANAQTAIAADSSMPPTPAPKAVDAPTAGSFTIEANLEIQESLTEPALALSEIEELWPRVIAVVKESNGPLSSLLKNSQPLSVDGHRLKLGVKFLFDKHNLETAKNSALISEAFIEVCGKKIVAEGLVSKPVAKAENQGSLSEALKIFGGELIE